MTESPPTSIFSLHNWRLYVLAAIPLVALGITAALGPIAQPQSYHLFADRRAWLGVPNFGDVASNGAFLLTGALGLIQCLRCRPEGARHSWIAFFGGVVLVCAGSAYYHWSPTNQTLVWDRLPMTIGFMGLYVALLSEFVEPRLERYLLAPAVLVGIASVAYWVITDDLRFYFGVQVLALVSVAVIVLTFRNSRGQNRYLGAAFVCYALAVTCEQLDREIFEFLNQAISGHTLKHLLAALAPFSIYRMLHARDPAVTG